MNLKFTIILSMCGNILVKVNKYFNDHKPWELEKNNKDKFINVLAITAEQIKYIAIFIIN